MHTARFVLWLSLMSACADAGAVGRLCPAEDCDASKDGSAGDRTVEPPPPSGATSSDGPPAPSATCSGGEIELQRRRLDVYMMVDDSGSMVLVWSDTMQAIDAFLRDPASTGVGVGLQFFGTECDADVYATPRIDISPLPANADRLMGAFPPIPLNETASLPAIKGAVTYAKAWADDHPNRDVAVLYMTDGFTDECESTVENVAQVAREANQGQPSIPTYVVVIGAIGALNLFASAGGTGDARLATPGSALELLNALNDVRRSAQSCRFMSPRDEQLQSDSLVVMRELADGTRVAVPRVKDADWCDPQTGGFYTDGARTPPSIALCAELCHTLGADRILAATDCD